MSNKMIYCIDLTEEITPVKVRDAIIECFTQAQEELIKSTKTITGLQQEEAKKINVDLLIEDAFDTVGGDFNNPTKESLIKVITKLKEFATDAFRDAEIIEKHAGEIMLLINKLE